MSGRPHGAVLALLAAGLTLLPVASALGLGEIGGYRMFTRLVHARLELVATGGAPVAFDELSPHLHHDARRVIGAAMRGGTVGDTAIVSLAAAAGPLAELACSLDAERTTVTTRRVDLEGGDARVIERVWPCAR